MTEFDMLWNRNKDLMDENMMLTRQLAKVLISPDHTGAVQAAKEAFATLELTDPFAPKESMAVTEKARKTA